jgi:catechol 2,3-dioxygenase-like lactoylglutathione lyase family enzyme
MQDKLRFEGLTLTVVSVARSVEFYGGLLGLEVAYNSEPAFAMIKIGGDHDGTMGLLSIDEARKEGVEESTPAQRRAVTSSSPPMISTGSMKTSRTGA